MKRRREEEIERRGTRRIADQLGERRKNAQEQRREKE
jgi:hypothetical protein